MGVFKRPTRMKEPNSLSAFRLLPPASRLLPSALFPFASVAIDTHESPGLYSRHLTFNPNHQEAHEKTTSTNRLCLIRDSYLQCSLVWLVYLWPHGRSLCRLPETHAAAAGPCGCPAAAEPGSAKLARAGSTQHLKRG